MSIHPLALVDPRARLGSGVRVGPWAIIEAGVELGDDVEIGPHCAILGDTRLGPRCVLTAHVVLGAPAQDRKYRGEPSRLEIGAANTFREYSTAHRGTGEGGCTRVGDGGLFMVGSHIAHDCQIGDQVVMANHVALAGHVEIGSQAVIGGLAAVHQHCRIGRLAMVGGGAMVAQDVPPFSLAQGDRARLLGLNRTGLERAGWGPEALRALQLRWRAVVQRPRRSPEELRAQFADDGVMEELLAFRESSARGLCRVGSSAGEA